MMKKLMSMAFHPAMFVLLIPLTGGCAVHAQGALRVPRVSVVASVPPPPRVTITASAPAPTASFVATTSSSTNVGVAASAPAPAPSLTTASTVVTPVDDGIELGEGESVYTVSVSAAPPPPPSRVVVTPPPARAGYVWVGAHYSWNGVRWVWTIGRWITARADFDWVPPRFDSSRMVFVAGHWESRRLADRNLRPRPSPVDHDPSPAYIPAPPPIVIDTPASTNANANVSVGFRAEASIEAGTR